MKVFRATTLIDIPLQKASIDWAIQSGQFINQNKINF